MTQANTPSQTHLSLKARVLIGAGIGLAVISFFLIGSNADPAWGKYWMIRPLIVVPFAGAMAGLCNYYIVHFRWVLGVNRPLAIIASSLVSIVGIWIGIVLGLAGTMWN